MLHCESPFFRPPETIMVGAPWVSDEKRGFKCSIRTAMTVLPEISSPTAGA
ncbi:hypothetical protein J2S73_003088 [Amorphus orientalis]|uniref:Uncharacterized protein n=1 Tax=Amorphus orientalis TaxID=649198 RepID=A0AAE3VR40_9HYPH|nr:hypothetical protein [Amorphus orientalis]